MICEPIFKKLKVGEHVIWDDQCQDTFDKINKVLSSPPVLSPSVAGLPLSLYLTIMDTAMGVMLAQTVDKEERDIYYNSKKILDYEVKYTPLEKTCLALVWATKKLRHYMLSYSLDFNVTNNAAEYEACLLGLRSALNLGVKKLLAHGDSSLVINQVGGSWKIKSKSLAPYQTRIEEFEKYFKDIRYVHLPRQENQFADALSKLPALINIPDHIDSMPICVKRRSSPAYVNAIDDAKEGKIEPWYTTILKFKETREYPPDLDTRGKRDLRMLFAQFIKSNDGQLYKKTAQGVLLRCIDKTTAKKVMEEVHDGECGPHMNAHMLIRKIIRLGYYWTTMETDCCKYVRHCHNCQIFVNIQQVAASMLYTMTSPWPFSTWGINIIRELEGIVLSLLQSTTLRSG
ncbi:uncharacterized protein LOC141632316 [Silene latifolia]|uniref:uncharacterized protein LOC141632316 n=1 Tax=Silene latifolia TaxID=37657 RepID=UPI003D78850A